MPETSPKRRARPRRAALDEGFYAELLHVAGLRETVANGKPAIARQPAHAREPGSLIENALARIEATANAPRDEAQRFDLALRLVVAWICGLVFRKLVEARRVALHGHDARYAFLRADRIGSFAQLGALCRGESLPELAPMFDAADWPNGPITLDDLADHPPLPLFAHTALTHTNDALPPLTYLLDFLDAFDFDVCATRSAEPRNRRLDAATPGLIFEKLNAYRDGAWFTPGPVAMHLCRAAIESALLQRANRIKGWQCETVDRLCQSIDDRDGIREIVDSLRICDPAVGSGHLLVSALNALVWLKARLGLLTGFDDYGIDVVAERLIVQRRDGAPIGASEQARLDRVLLREKRAIVENALYGVDINEDAVRMTRLRLSIELLMHAGLDDLDSVAVLPKLTSHIKRGDATLSQFAINSRLPGIANETRREIAHAPEHATSFEWRLDFPDLLDDDGTFRGFDVVVANPPYIDAERMVNAGQRDLRARLAQRWPSAKGNWDLYIVFMELGVALLARDGAAAFLTPDKWLSKPFGDAFRARHLRNIARIVALGRDVFDEAGVDSIVTVCTREASAALATARLSEGTLTPISTTPKTSLRAPWRLDALLSPHRALARRIAGAHARLGALLPCENACATSDAYRLKPLIAEANGDYSAQRHYRVLNTGTLGRFVARWSDKPMTYLGDRYRAPVVERAQFAATFANGYRAKADAKKVIVKGLTRLDATLDLAGDVIPGKTTLILRSADDDLLKFAAALLNSPVAAFYLRACYPSSSYNGGIAFTKAMIDAMPAPASRAKQNRPARLVDQFVAFDQAGFKARAEAIAREIDRVLYRAFGLSDADVACIEAESRARRR